MKFVATIASHARRVGSIFLEAGPVGLGYAVSLYMKQRRMNRIESCIDSENELHRQMKANLRTELNDAIADHQATQIAAATFWAHCKKTNDLAAAAGSRT